MKTILHSSFNWQDVLIFLVISALMQTHYATFSLIVDSAFNYRYFTAHFAHNNWEHWLLNMGVLVALPYVVANIPRWIFWVFCLFASFAISLLMIETQQLNKLNVYSYAGFSGILHGIYVLFASHHILQRHHFFKPRHTQVSKKPIFYWQNIFLIIIILIKISYELTAHPNLTDDFIKTVVMHEAHAFGVLCAFVFLLVLILWQKIFAKRHN